MMLLVHCSPKTLAPYRCDNLGVLCSPREPYADDIQEWPWAADNDAFKAWDAGRYRAMLDKIDGREGCLFVTAPDIVGDAWGTLERFNEWFPILEGRFPVAYVGQDGQEDLPMPWEAIDALFIGGTTEWKLGDHAAALIRDAKERGLWVHMGRVNSFRRARMAWALGCDSIDGSQFNWFRDTKLVPYLARPMLPRTACST